MESAHESVDFKKRMVLAVCSAGSDRSRYIADVLNERGYIASNGGVLQNHNYVTVDDLSNVGSIIFASKFEQAEFNKINKLRETVSKNGIEIHVMNITESDKERALQSNKVNELKAKISSQLDDLGFKKVEN